MTTRNLNKTWRDVVFQQYTADHDAEAPFPLRYLINAREWHKDIWIEVPNRIDVRTFRRSVLNFVVSKRGADPVFSDEHISVRPRISQHLSIDTNPPEEDFEQHEAIQDEQEENGS
ncbi:hypothetical protein GGR54DRAFT_63548 [Hypoxylon sp. NC1633]|nr:hypothetical protein GGR54DRAFT_63548 [Hypoxylon sp. NC1633]